jgi:hypothetical protein
VASFGSDQQRRRHFRRHGAEFAVGTAAEYEARASAFCSDDPCPADVLQYVRYCADDDDPKRVRYREASGEYGVMLRDQPLLCTYHFLYPSGAAAAPYSHPYATNAEFVAADRDCARQGQGGPHA